MVNAPLPLSSSSSSSLSLSPETPSVVINEPPDEALIHWLKECRVDQESVEMVRKASYFSNDHIDSQVLDCGKCTKILDTKIFISEKKP